MGNKTCLVLRFSALGDIAMTVPVIYSEAYAYPDMRFYVATRPFFSRMFINPPSNVKVLSFDIKKDYKGVFGTLRLARRLAKLHPDYVADLHNLPRTVFISNMLRLTGAKVAIVDKARSERRKVYAGGPKQTQYIQRYFDTFSRLGLDAPCSFKSIYQESGQPKTPVTVVHPAVGIAPFARYETKSYPDEKMHRVVKTLAEKGVNVYLFSGRGPESEILESWEGPGIKSLAGKFHLEEEIAIMSHLDVMVSMDSSNQHLAALSGTKVISVWGSTTPACGFLGFGQTMDDTVCLDIPCQPCSIAGLRRCPRGDMECLETLPPEMIVDKIMSKIS